MLARRTTVRVSTALSASTVTAHHGKTPALTPDHGSLRSRMPRCHNVWVNKPLNECHMDLYQGVPHFISSSFINVQTTLLPGSVSDSSQFTLKAKQHL
jgi:hypothetical protein